MTDTRRAGGQRQLAPLFAPSWPWPRRPPAGPASLLLAHRAAPARPVRDQGRRIAGQPADLEANAAIDAMPAGGVSRRRHPERGERRQPRAPRGQPGLDRGSPGWHPGLPGAHRRLLVSTSALAIDGAPAVGVVYRPVPGIALPGRRGQGALSGSWPAAPACGSRLEWSAVASFASASAATTLRRLCCAWLEAEGLAGRALRPGRRPSTRRWPQGDLDAVVTVTGGEKEWDSCAPELIVREAGGMVTDGDGQPAALQPAGRRSPARDGVQQRRLPRGAAGGGGGAVCDRRGRP